KQPHVADDAFSLQLLLHCAQRLVNVVIANDYLKRSTAPSKLIQTVRMKTTWQQSPLADYLSQSPLDGSIAQDSGPVHTRDSKSAGSCGLSPVPATPGQQ